MRTAAVLLSLGMVAAIACACARVDPPAEPPPPAIEGSWVVTWMDGYDREELTIERTEAISKKYRLHFVRTTDVGRPTEWDREAVFVDDALLLDRAYDFCGYKYAVLSLEKDGDDLVLVPYPNPGALLDAGDARAVYRRPSGR